MHAYWQLCALCAVLQSFCCIRDGRFSSTSKIAKFSRVPVSSFKILPAYGQMHACMHCVRTVRPVEKTACCVIGGFPAPGPALPPRRVCVCVPVPPAPPPQNKRTGQEGIQSSLPSSWPASSQHPTQRQHGNRGVPSSALCLHFQSALHCFHPSTVICAPLHPLHATSTWLAPPSALCLRCTHNPCTFDGCSLSASAASETAVSFALSPL